MKVLKEHIKSGKYDNIYLFYGAENFLKDYYLTQMKENIVSQNEMMNMDIFDDENMNIDSIADSIETLPFMSEYRLIIVKMSNLFSKGKKDDVEKLLESLENVPETNIIIFVEETVDKRNKLYKFVDKKGSVVEFALQKEAELVRWIENALKKEGLGIDSRDASLIIRNVGSDMNQIKLNLDKLVCYVKEGTINEIDIEEVCDKTSEIKIFDLVKYIGLKDTKRAIETYESLLYQKEHPIMILTMIARQFKMLMQVKYLKGKGYDNRAIATKIGSRDFVVRDLSTQTNNFTLNDLKDAYKDSLEIDYAIKTGKIKPEAGVEGLIVKYSHKKS
ncbi:MAG: DNA polymerase III subunit delta [Clostridia bacterium]|jgi:DNA polymerase-3 subunit delta|nr:DNA polymerase III subunit delta [Clostridia bacterium]